MAVFLCLACTPLLILSVGLSRDSFAFGDATRMSNSEIKKKNHYVPRGYLKRWAAADDKICTYRILVSNANVPLWKRSTPSGVAYHQHLYTRIVERSATDEVERWLDKEYENPAEPVIERVLSQKKLTKDDWLVLIRYLACQDVRTPARLLESMKHQENTMHSILQGALDKAKQKLEQNKEDVSTEVAEKIPGSELFPLKISTQDQPGSDCVQVEARTTTGRSAWLFSIKFILQNSQSMNALLGHRWTILRAPKSFYWCTSDTPVIRLNYYSDEQYDFKGGWGSNGTEIIFPLDPRNVMYTKIGEKPPPRGTVVSVDFARTMQRIIIEHAHRFIFCQVECDEVPQIRPRTENASIFKEEQERWRDWHNNNVNAEVELQT